MSFVLEALKKQEADRDPDAAVSLARAAVQQRRHRLWMALFAVAMAVNVALLWWVLDPLGSPARQPEVAAGGDPEWERSPDRDSGWERSPDRDSGWERSPDRDSGWERSPDRDSEWERSPDREAAAARVAVVADAGKDSRSGDRSHPESSIQPESSARPDSRSGDRSHTEPRQPHNVALADLPADARARFPGIAFSTHIYAEDPELRAVVANGERHEEGDHIRGLEIVEITEGGVVLAFEAYRVEVPMVADWDSL